ncbi:hypothetical protein OFC56_37470, partial [Escherichia coli]|nr:hypothetical protein [Escherichia coli]
EASPLTTASPYAESGGVTLARKRSFNVANSPGGPRAHGTRPVRANSSGSMPSPSRAAPAAAKRVASASQVHLPIQRRVSSLAG